MAMGDYNFTLKLPSTDVWCYRSYHVMLCYVDYVVGLAIQIRIVINIG